MAVLYELRHGPVQLEPSCLGKGSQWYGRVVGAAQIELPEQRHHADVACYAEHADGHGGFLADVDLALSAVVHHREGLRVSPCHVSFHMQW